MGKVTNRVVCPDRIVCKLPRPEVQLRCYQLWVRTATHMHDESAINSRLKENVR